LGLALDEPKDSDKVFDQDDLKFVVEGSLLTSCGSIKVDFMDAGPRSGFSISSSIPLGSSGSGSCGSCGGGTCG
jgi:Fe-S cluster assembly iron-binding protein IscA